MTVDSFESPRRCESPEMSTITRMATLPSAILVIVDIFEFRTSSESRKTSTVTRMATVTPAIPVTVDTFRISESKNDDSYKETRGGASQTFEKKRGAKPWKTKILHRFRECNKCAAFRFPAVVAGRLKRAPTAEPQEGVCRGNRSLRSLLLLPHSP